MSFFVITRQGVVSALHRAIEYSSSNNSEYSSLKTPSTEHTPPINIEKQTHHNDSTFGFFSTSSSVFCTLLRCLRRCLPSGKRKSGNSFTLLLFLKYYTSSASANSHVKRDVTVLRVVKVLPINPLALAYGEQRRLELPRRRREVQRRLRAVLLRRERDVELLAERTVRL